jgi:hypothetical protein
VTGRRSRLSAAIPLLVALLLASGGVAGGGETTVTHRPPEACREKGLSERRLELSLRVSESRKKVKSRERCLRLKRLARRPGWNRR